MIRGGIVFLSALITIGACSVAAPRAETEEERVLNSRFEETYVSAHDGLRLYARVVGTGPDTVLIPLGAWLARDLTPLAQGRTLIFFDPRGRGGSDFVVETTRLGVEHDVRDMEAVRSYFGIERVSLIGWSYLGAVVILYAADYPERVRQIVQVGPMAPRRATSVIPDQRGSPPDSADREFIAELQNEGVPDTNPTQYCRAFVMRALIRPMMGRPDSAVHAELDPCMYWNEWPDQLFRTARNVVPQDWDYSELARNIEVPVLTIHGTDDPNAAVEGGREWASLLPKARLIEIEGVGHAPWLESPERFFGEVDRFLSEGGEP